MKKFLKWLDNTDRSNKWILAVLLMFFSTLAFIWFSIPYFADKYSSHVKYSRQIKPNSLNNVEFKEENKVVDVSVDRSLPNDGYASVLGPEHPYMKAKRSILSSNKGKDLTDDKFQLLIDRHLARYSTGESALQEQIKKENKILDLQYKNRVDSEEEDLKLEDIIQGVNKESSVRSKGNDLTH